MSNREPSEGQPSRPDLLLAGQSCILWRVPSLKSTLPIVALLALGLPAGAQNTAPVAPKQAPALPSKVAVQTKATLGKQAVAKTRQPKKTVSATKAKKGKVP